MAIASPSAPSLSASLRCSRTDFNRFVRLPMTLSHQPMRRLKIITALNSSNPPNDSVSPDNDDLEVELLHGVSLQRRSEGSPVYVTLPVDTLDSSGKMRRRRAIMQSIRALAVAGVEGVVMEVWWGIVEKDAPRVYNWQGYAEILSLARRYGMKVRAVMAFHQCGSRPRDYWIPLPQWVLEEMDKDLDLAYCDRFGRRNREYISLGCDILPVLHGRSPIQAYADFMRNFRDTFEPLLGCVITGIQVGMGPCGELRYPSCPSEKLTWDWHSRELGEFQCYDKYMLLSLNTCAREIGMPGWANGGPMGAGNLMQNPEHTDFFKSDGSWNSPYGEFFLEWYSKMLLLHGERICREATTIFQGTEVNTSGKIATIHWHYNTQSHPSELTAGYYNTCIRDGYLPIARMFGMYGFTLCCTCFEMQDALEQRMMNSLNSSPEGFLKQLLMAARICHVPVEGENCATSLNDESGQHVLEMSKFYSAGLETPSFSFNFNRMDKDLFQPRNWLRFTRFVRQMSDGGIFRAELGFRGGDKSVSVANVNKGAVFAH